MASSSTTTGSKMAEDPGSALRWGITSSVTRMFAHKESAIVLLLPDGTVRLYSEKTTVAEVLREFPDCHVGSHTSLRCQLAPEKVLRPGSTYYLATRLHWQEPSSKNEQEPSEKQQSHTKHRRTSSMAPRQSLQILRQPSLCLEAPSPKSPFPDFSGLEGNYKGPKVPKSQGSIPTQPLLSSAQCRVVQDNVAALSSPEERYYGGADGTRPGRRWAHRRVASMQALEIPADILCMGGRFCTEQEESREMVSDCDGVGLPLSPGFFSREEGSTPGSSRHRRRSRRTPSSVGGPLDSPTFEASVPDIDVSNGGMNRRSPVALQGLLPVHSSSDVFEYSPERSVGKLSHFRAQREVRVSVTRASSNKERGPARTSSSSSNTGAEQGPSTWVRLPGSLSVDEYGVLSPTSSASFSPGAMGSSESSCGTPGSVYSPHWDSPRCTESPRTNTGPYCLTPFFKEPKPTSRFKEARHDV